jgi:hypothetical protein
MMVVFVLFLSILLPVFLVLGLIRISGGRLAGSLIRAVKTLAKLPFFTSEQQLGAIICGTSDDLDSHRPFKPQLECLRVVEFPDFVWVLSILDKAGINEAGIGEISSRLAVEFSYPTGLQTLEAALNGQHT